MNFRILAVSFALAPVTVYAQQPSEQSTLAQIRAEGLEHSHAWAMVDTLATVIGPRLTASPAFVRAVHWARNEMAAIGLENAHLESWPFGRGWELDRFSLAMTAPRFAPLIGYPDAWSEPTKGEITGTPIVIAGLSYDSLAKMRDQLRGAIVMLQPMMTNFVRQDRVNPTAPGVPDVYKPLPPLRLGGRGGRVSEAMRIATLLHDAGVGAVLKTSRGEHGTVFVQTRDAGPERAVPSVVLGAEDYNNILRMLGDHLPVRVSVNVQAHYVTTDTSGYNVIGELPGTDPALRDQVVMIGAHLDSWGAATGATDNADGAATVLEAMRILKAVGARPRRTIRVALWGGEEEGLYGSRAWVAQHLAGPANKSAREHMSVYLNIDPGYGPVYGFFMEGNQAAKSIFDQWLAPLADLGARRNVIAGISNTDHLSFMPQGVPAFNPVQEYTNYDVRIHHTNVDTMDRMNPTDLEESAIVFATFAYDAAMRDEMIPRAPGSTVDR